MKKYPLIFWLVLAVSTNFNVNKSRAQNIPNETSGTPGINAEEYKYPSFYKGIYLNVYSARNTDRLYSFIEMAKGSNVNAFVLDIQRGNDEECAVTAKNVEYCVKNNIHPIARIVVFTDGLKHYPIPDSLINNRIMLAENACKNGFKEIQFDYIRFSDYKISKRLSLKEKYDVIEGFLKKARNHLKKYNVRIAADIFGRIPLNQDDAIGQKMEILDNVVDIICPMAYPSHYTWSNKMMSDPYYTVYLTSKRAKERAKKAEIVTYIQAFKMKLNKTNLSFSKYIEEQIKAVHDSGIRGYLLWNASQKYDTAFEVMKEYYDVKKEAVVEKTKPKKQSS